MGLKLYMQYNNSILFNMIIFIKLFNYKVMNEEKYGCWEKISITFITYHLRFISSNEYSPKITGKTILILND